MHDQNERMSNSTIVKLIFDTQGSPGGIFQKELGNFEASSPCVQYLYINVTWTFKFATILSKSNYFLSYDFDAILLQSGKSKWLDENPHYLYISATL